MNFFRGVPEQLTNRTRLHSIPVRKRPVKIEATTVEQKIKWRAYGNKLLRAAGAEPVIYISDEEEGNVEDDDEDEDVKPPEIKKTEPPASSSKPNPGKILSY